MPLATPLIIAQVARRQLGLLPLVMVMFFTVSGGAYGLEDLVGSSGPGMALTLLLVTPLIWSVPIALMVAELTALMPVQGGYYAWVKRALGPFWGFQEGWWSWITTFVDMAIYPVLFADYLATLLDKYFGWPVLNHNPLAHWLVACAVIWTCAALNLRGACTVGRLSSVFGVFILLPFLILSILDLAHWFAHPIVFWRPFTPPGSAPLDAFGLGLFVVMWNYMGWDGLSTVSDEITNARRNYPRALALTLILVTVAYVLPVAAGLAAAPDWTRWTAGYFPAVAARIGGPWLGVWLALGGLVSGMGLFNSLMLSVSRLPLAMARDGWLPVAITRIHPRFGTPWVAITVCAAIYSLFSLNAFSTLVVVDVVLYSAALLLEFATLIALRITLPDAERPFRVPGGWIGVAVVTALPVSILLLAVTGTAHTQHAGTMWLSLAVLATGPLLYPVLLRYVKRDRPDVAVPVVAPG